MELFYLVEIHNVKHHCHYLFHDEIQIFYYCILFSYSEKAIIMTTITTFFIL